jgi:16S rRNA (guanine527-N7)-methyltransferase
MLPLNHLLEPFISQPLSPEQLKQFELYLELLLKWNAKISLTAIRSPEDIVRRHFGESLFAGEHLNILASSSLHDFGSGAGFPGLPVKISSPQLDVTLIESQQKKAAFLREVIRTLKLEKVNVHADRAELLKRQAQIVTMRAVEKFASALPVAASLVEPGGRLALLIGTSQVQVAMQALPRLEWRDPVHLPESRERVLLVGQTVL